MWTICGYADVHAMSPQLPFLGVLDVLVTMLSQNLPILSIKILQIFFDCKVGNLFEGVIF